MSIEIFIMPFMKTMKKMNSILFKYTIFNFFICLNMNLWQRCSNSIWSRFDARIDINAEFIELNKWDQNTKIKLIKTWSIYDLEQIKLNRLRDENESRSIDSIKQTWSYYNMIKTSILYLLLAFIQFRCQWFQLLQFDKMINFLILKRLLYYN